MFIAGKGCIQKSGWENSQNICHFFQLEEIQGHQVPNLSWGHLFSYIQQYSLTGYFSHLLNFIFSPQGLSKLLNSFNFHFIFFPLYGNGLPANPARFCSYSAPKSQPVASSKQLVASSEQLYITFATFYHSRRTLKTFFQEAIKNIECVFSGCSSPTGRLE